ncbi:MAG: TonB family protein [Novosphingobium sp.]
MVVAALAVLMAVAAPAIPPPPVIADEFRRSGERGLAAWTPGDVRCGGTGNSGVTVSGDPLRRPLSTLGWRGANGQRPVTLRFDIDAGGRPISITREDARFVPNDDVAPALAASRFPAGAHSACSVTYSVVVTPFATAAVPDLVSYTVTPISGRLPMPGWRRIREGSDCADAPRPQPLVRTLPDFAKLPATPGMKEWALVAYDTDAKGKPVNVRVETGTGNKALDAAAVKAMRASRFTGGARKACSYPYWRQPEVLAAPPMPDKSAFPAGDNCPAGQGWASEPVLRFPQAYNRRRIEGWAVVSYDIALWGAVGNAKVLAAQPSDDFGRQALQVIQSAKAAPSEHGRSGCVERIRFAIHRDADGAADGADDAPDPIILGG